MTLRRAYFLAPRSAKNSNTQAATIAPNEYSNGARTESTASHTMFPSMLTMT